MSDLYQFFDAMNSRLSNKHYNELVPPLPLAKAYMKTTFGGTIPKVVGIVLANTDGPEVTFQRVEGWFKQLIGNTGEGVLLFVYQTPSAHDVEVISQISGQVVAGTYALDTDEYWMTSYMGWDQELFH